MCKEKDHRITISISILKQEISLIAFAFAFVDDADLFTGTKDTNTTGTALIAKFEALMTRYNGRIRASGG